MYSPPRETGLDVVKAISIILVVIWHLQPIRAEMFTESNTFKHAINFFYFDVSLLAVPSFILVSLYIFIAKLSQAKDYWKKRFIRLIQIYVFWVGVHCILYLLLGGAVPFPLEAIFRSGGPDLPLQFAIPSVLYYLFILLVCTVLTFLFFKLPEKIKLVASIAIIGLSLTHFLLSPLYGISIDTRSMRGYYIYVPVAYYLYRYKNQFSRYSVFFFAGFLVSVYYEWAVSGMTSAYARLPVFFGALAFVSVCISVYAAVNRPVSLLSKYSLGIFALHPYWMAVFVWLFSASRIRYEIDYLVNGILEGILLCVLTFLLTCISIYILGKTKLRVYVS